LQEISNILLAEILEAMTGLVNRIDTLETEVETLALEKAAKIGEITFEGIFTPAGGTGVYEIVSL